MNVIFHIERCGFPQKSEVNFYLPVVLAQLASFVYLNQTFYALFFAEVFEDAFDFQIRRIVCNTKLIRE
jgi:hypothetical protein